MSRPEKIDLWASCATDWVKRCPSHVVAKWLGHPPKVAAHYYLVSREHHFEDVVRVNGVGRPEGGTATAPECDAYCSARRTKNATQEASAPNRVRPHEMTEPADTTRVPAGSSEIAPFDKTAPRQDAAQKQAALAMDGSAAVNPRHDAAQQQAALAMDGSSAVIPRQDAAQQQAALARMAVRP